MKPCVISFRFAAELVSGEDEDRQEDDDLIETLKNADAMVSKDNEMKAWSFLETRTALLLKAYPTTLEVSTRHKIASLGIFISRRREPRYHN